MELTKDVLKAAEKYPELAEMLTEVAHLLDNPLELFCKREAESQLIQKNYHGASEKTIEEISKALLEKHEIYNAPKIINKEKVREIVSDYIDKHFTEIRFQMENQGISFTCKTEQEKNENVKRQLDEIYRNQCKNCKANETFGMMMYHISKNRVPVTDINSEEKDVS